jgi:cobalt import ATP-binding protein cbiO 1
VVVISGIIEFRNVSYSKNNNMILENISFSLKKNKYNVIIGKNGSGKSTILKLIVGLEKISGGQIFIDNEELVYKRDELYKIRKKTGIVFQESNEYIIGETVAESLIFGMENNRIPLEKMKENMTKYVKLFQLENIIDKKTVNLSGGEKQKVALAGAVITEPEIILLDEVTEMWDKTTKDKMNGIIEEFLKDGKTVVSVTHSPEEIKRSDNIVFITEEGKIVTGKSEEVNKIIEEKENTEINHEVISEYSADLTKISLKEEEIKVKIKNISYYYEKERKIIDSFSVNIPKDSITAITGKSGTGKTTLIEIISGLAFLGENFSGEIEYNFRNENKEKEDEKLLLYKNISERELYEIRKRIGIVFQNTGEQFFSGTVLEELEYNITKKYKIKNKKSKELSDRINEIAEIFGYDEKFLMKSPFVLSGGEKKMLGLALAVCLEPEILVLDEPTGALDYNTTVKFMKIVEKMKKNGTTVILVTHDENIVKQYSDYILKLQFKG